MFMGYRNFRHTNFRRVGVSLRGPFVTLYFDKYNGVPVLVFFLLYLGQNFQSIPIFKLWLEIEIQSLTFEGQVWLVRVRFG